LGPVFSSQLWKYHVFLSFRGEDTRKTFVDHLYTTLVQQGIFTYKDDETLPQGESIGPSLVTAIEESQIAIIIFSKNYADSSWCLDELVHIMKCKDTRDQIVMPIFYDVDPSEVRKQKGKYGEAFAKHELEKNTKVESWRKALVDASNLSGWEPKHIANGHESKCIETVVYTISHRLRPISTSSVDDKLVGVEARMQDLISNLQIGFGGKRMIGIWGVGGGGKTTLASCIYDKISSKFDGCCFLKNIQEESSNKNGLTKLQAEILCDVLKLKQLKLKRVEEGRHMIKDRLQHRKVLIVLDDVDNLEHLEELAGSRDWFGEGSRVLITTRDEHVLTGHKVDVIHNISLLNNDESMKLFCKHAPLGHKTIEDYEQLSKDVVSYAAGLPLALRVLGRFLCEKETNEWRSALARLKEIPDASILEVLKISFDGLKPIEKELFLDIACFFRRGFKIERAILILDACGFHPVIGIKVLVQKALITISEDGTFDMHDLVQELAHYIVRGEYPKNPEKHSRIWNAEDVLTLCAMDATMELDKIEAICGHHFRSDDGCVLRVAANMKKLRWISLNFERLEDGLVETTHPLMPENFPPRELCCLTLCGFHGKELWEGYKYLPNLRMIELHELKTLIKTPDFGGLPNLERFMVYLCFHLEEIHPSFGHLEKLAFVEIDYSRNLKMPPDISRSKELETLTLSGFSSGCLRKLDLSQCNLGDGDIRSAVGWELPNLQQLSLEGNGFVRLSFRFFRLPRLKCLNVSYSYDLVELSELPSSVAVVLADDCTSLETLGDISNCKWLWKVSLLWGEKLAGDIILDSMLRGNAKDYFISINLSNMDIWSGPSALWVDLVKNYNMSLPHDWYNHFSGILMFFQSNKNFYSDPNIAIKVGVHENFQCELGQKSNETLKTHNPDTYVGYVSFSSLRHTGCLNSIYKIISFSLDPEGLYGDGYMFRAVLVPKDDTVQTTKVTTDSSEFWDEEELYERKTFTIQHDSNSSVEFLWHPFSHFFYK
ncbi:TMV resistance protein N, partial [Lactuca sativa]